MGADPDIKRAPRLILPRRDLNLRPGNVYTIEGPRRVGKTLWIKRKIASLIGSGVSPEEIGYFLAERALSRREFVRVLDFFARRDVGYLFLDEVQGIANWPVALKAFYEEYGDSVSIVVTGSPLSLSSETAALIGRGIEGNRYLMLPHTFPDVVAALSSLEGFEPIRRAWKDPLAVYEDLSRVFWMYLESSGFPLAFVNRVLSGNIPDALYHQLRLQTRKRADEPDYVEALAVALAERIASRISYANLARDLDTDVKSVERRMRFLEQRHVLRVILAVDSRMRPRRRGGIRKAYFVDHAFVYALLAPYEDVYRWVRNEVLPDEEWLGRILEHVVAQHLCQIYYYPLLGIRGLHFLLRGEREYDFVVERDGGWEKIEVKLNAQPSDADVLVTLDDYGENAVPAPIYLLSLQKNRWHL